MCVTVTSETQTITQTKSPFFDFLSKEVQTIPITTKMLTGTITGTKSLYKASDNKKGLDEII
jgi:hypothetical protein